MSVSSNVNESLAGFRGCSPDRISGSKDNTASEGQAAVDIALLGQRGMQGGPVTPEEARELLQVTGEDVWDLLYWAHKAVSYTHLTLPTRDLV